MSSLQLLFYRGPTDEYSLVPPHQDTSTPPVRPLKNLFFDVSVPALQSEDCRRSICNGIRWLPLGSLVKAFAAGSPHISTPGQIPFTLIFKNWHQRPNEHCSVKLGWADTHGKNEVVFAKAHVHRNGLEMVFLERDGRMLTTKPRTPPETTTSLPSMILIPTNADWTNSDEEALRQVP